jgi:hypothetical protein
MKKLTPGTLGQRRKADPTIRFNRKNGQVQISSSAKKRTGLDIGNHVTFYLNNTSKKVYMSISDDGFEVKGSKPEMLLIQCVRLCREVIDCVNRPEASVKFLVAMKDSVDQIMCHELIPIR